MGSPDGQRLRVVSISVLTSSRAEVGEIRRRAREGKRDAVDREEAELRAQGMARPKMGRRRRMVEEHFERPRRQSGAGLGQCGGGGHRSAHEAGVKPDVPDFTKGILEASIRLCGLEEFEAKEAGCSEDVVVPSAATTTVEGVVERLGYSRLDSREDHGCRWIVYRFP